MTGFMGRLVRSLPDRIWCWWNCGALRRKYPDMRHFSECAFLSVFFGHRLTSRVRAIFPRGVLNLHPGLRPFNRGAYPNVWSIVERTPAGATLHYMDDGIDTGPIVAQHAVEVAATDTGSDLYRKLERACIEALIKGWPRVLAGDPPAPQGSCGGTSHRRADVGRIDEIVLDRSYVARDIIDVIRARTFAPYAGAYFYDDRGRKVFLRMQLLHEGEIEGGHADHD